MESVNSKTLTNNSTVNAKIQTVDIDILNLVLTPLTCASLISEIFKCLIFQKSLIPYPYNWLKRVVTERRKSNVENDNYCNEKKHRVASAAFDAAENIMNNIRKLFKLGNKVQELLVLIGATPLNPKEVYRIKIPMIANGHIENNHYSMTSKFQPIILRSLLLSEEWMSKMDQNLSFTNLYVFVKMANDTNIIIDTKTFEHFIPSSTFYIPKSAQSLTINLLYDKNISHNCCTNFTIYEDECITNILEKKNEEKTKNKLHNSRENKVEKNEELLELNIDWLQMNSILKGFK